jgi:SAM-dependent methyltransferase
VQQSLDLLTPQFRPSDLRAALDDLAGQDETERGAVFTRAEVVAALLDLAGYADDRPLHLWSVLEPSFGAGDFLLPAVERLLTACAKADVTPDKARQLRAAVRGVEVHPASFEATREALRARLLAWGAQRRDAIWLCDAWLVRDDFLLAPLEGLFDVVVGNPPYVRQERIAAPLLAEYRRRYRTIYDRADLYVPFFERGLQLLREGGRLAFICANRWLKNKYGGPLRGLIARDFHLSHYIDMEGTDAFQAEVIAYPAITVIRRGQGTVTRIARRPDVVRELPAIARAMTGEGPVDHPNVEEVERAVSGNEPWLLDAADQLRVLRRLERDFVEVEDAECKVGIGVATGADKIYIGNFTDLPVEDARKLPLAMAPDLQDGALVWGGKGVVNPFEPDGSLAALDRYPRFAAYIHKHQDTLARRHVAQKSASGWYRTIDRIYAELTATPKLLIPDIKGEPMVVFDEGGYYPHHNLYFVTSSTWDLRALATILRSSVAVLFVSAYCVKMAGGFLRFQAQYLRRIRIPRWADVSETTRAALIGASPTDPTAIDRAAFAAYRLTDAEAETVRRVAAEARVARKDP